MPSPDLRRGGHPGEAFGDCPRTSSGAREVKASLAKRKVSLANWKISLAKGFLFRTRSAKPLETFCFSRPRNFRIRGFQCYQRLAADFVSRFFLDDDFASLGGTRSLFFFTEQFTLP
jgi:hypothetical protein